MSQKNEYDKLRALWYKILKEDGFEDIESDDNNLKVWSSKYARNSPGLWQAKEAYYHMATNFLNDYKFKDKIERIIWEYHAEAISIRDIVQLLNDTKVLKTNRDAVWLTVKRLENIMKKLYLPTGQDNE